MKINPYLNINNESSTPKYDCQGVSFSNCDNLNQETENAKPDFHNPRDVVKYQLNGKILRIILPGGKETFPIRGTKASMARKKKVLQIYPKVHHCDKSDQAED